MSGNAATLRIELEVDEKGGVKVVRSFGDESEKAGKKGKTAFDQMGNSAKTAGANIGKMLATAAGIVGLGLAYNKLKTAAGEWVGLANTQEAAETKLGATIRATGGAAGYTLGELKAMASGMQGLTTTGDEVTLAGMSVLTTFKQIRGEGFQRATAAAIDMQAVMGGPLQSSIVMIGKALNDPIANLSAMSRAGVQFTEEQKEMINTLWEAGETERAQAIILSELEGQFGGTAAALRETFAGSVTAAGNALGDMKEEAGFVITKNQFLIELVHQAEKQFVAWGAKIAENREGLMQMTKDGILYVADGVGFVVETMRFFHNGWLGLRLVAQKALEGIGWMLEKDIAILRAFLAPLDLVFDALVKMGSIDANPFDSMQAGISQFWASSADVTKNIMADIQKTNAAYDTVGDTIKTMRDKIAEIPVAQKTATNDQIVSLQSVATEVKKTEKQKEKERKKAEKAAEKARKAAEKAEKQAIKDREAAYETMYGTLTWEADGYYDYSIKRLKEEAKEFEARTGDKALAAQWLNQKTKSLNDAQLKYHQDMEEKKLMASDDFFAGFSSGLDESKGDIESWAQAGAYIADELASSLRSSLADSLNVTSENFLDFGGIAENVFEGVASAAANAAADIVVDWGVAAAKLAANWALENIFGNFHTGAWNVTKEDEGVAVVQAGEMIIRQQLANKIRDYFVDETAFEQVVNSLAAIGASGAGSYGAAIASATGGATGLGGSVSVGTGAAGSLGSGYGAISGATTGASTVSGTAAATTSSAGMAALSMAAQVAGYAGLVYALGSVYIAGVQALKDDEIAANYLEQKRLYEASEHTALFGENYQVITMPKEQVEYIFGMMTENYDNLLDRQALPSIEAAITAAFSGDTMPTPSEQQALAKSVDAEYGGLDSDNRYYTPQFIDGDLVKPAYGNRAYGGPVRRGGIYEILERGQPEVLSSGGRNFLLNGDLPGRVTPVANSGGGGGDVIQVTVMIGNEAFDAYIDKRADGVRVEAERRGLGAEPIYA